MAAPAAAAADRASFAAYLFTHAAWFLAFGLQMVLFPYLVRVVLGEDEVRFGFAQMSMQLPTTLLILIGGFVADRVDQRRALIAACCIAIATFLALGAFVATGQLTYGLVITYALTVGTLSAFAMPVRDALLSHVAPGQGPGAIQRAVGFASLAQFGAQLVGMALATLTPLIGVTALLFGQAGLMAAAAFSAGRIAPHEAQRKPAPSGGPLLFMAREIRDGLSAAIASPVIGPITLCALGMGVCFMGAFAVILPLIVQTYVQGGAHGAYAASLAIFSFCFWGGTMLSTIAIVRMPAMHRRGLIYLVALVSGSFVLALCALPVPFPVLCAINAVWGVGGGVAMTLGRGLVQQAAPPAMRARVLSIFALCTMGGGPIGAVAYGYLARAWGAHLAVLFPAGLMLIIAASMAIFSRLRTID